MTQRLQLILDDFHGMNQFDRSTRIPLEDAAFLQNCWTADASGSLETRPGEALSGLGSDKDFGSVVREVWRFHRDANNSFRIAYAYNPTSGHDEVWVLESGTWVKRVDLLGVRRNPVGTTLSLPDNIFFIANGADLLLQFDGNVWSSVFVALEGGDLSDVTFTGSGTDDMTTSGRHIHTAADGYKVEIDAVDSGIQSPYHVGVGLDDLTTSGTFTGTPVQGYHVRIIALGTDGAPDSFEWSDDGGGTWSAPVAITGGTQTLNNGVEITFGAFDTHTEDDWWWFWAGVDTYKWSDDGGSTFDAAGVPIVAGGVALNKGVSIVFGALEDHDLGDFWEFSGAVTRQITPSIVSQHKGHLIAATPNNNKVYYSIAAGAYANTENWTFLTAYQSGATFVSGIADWEIPIIFTDSAMFAVSGFPDSIRIERIAGYGCINQQSIVDIGGVLYWAGRGPKGFGIFRWGGGQPYDIAKKIRTRYTVFDKAAIFKCWATAYKGNYMLFYPNSADATSQCSRALVFNTDNGYWYEWQNMHFACGEWENAKLDIGTLYLGSNKGVGGGSDEYYIYKLTEGTYVDPFDSDGLEMIWDTADINFGDTVKPKEFISTQPHFKILDAGGSDVAGYIKPFIDSVAGANGAIDVSDPVDQIIAIQTATGEPFKAGHYLRLRFYYKGTKGVRYNSLKINFNMIDAENIAG